MFASLCTLCALAGSGYEWRTYPDGDTSQVALYQGGIQVGAYRYADDAYFPYDASAGRFGPRCAPPLEPPGRSNFGLDRERIRAGNHYRLNGRDATREQIEQLLQGGKDIPDNTRKLRIVIIGSDAERRPVVDDFAGPELAAWKDQAVIQDYAPDHWHVARAGYFTGGHPTIYVLAPDGTVLHRQDNYTGGASALADALRRARPDYQPEKDRDWRLPLPFRFVLPQIPWSVYVLAGLALVALLLRKKS
jgi:hypothetical protein